MEFLDNIFEYNDDLRVSGLTEELKILYILNYFKKYKEDVVIVTNTLFEATNIYNKFLTYTKEVLLFPMDDYLTTIMAVKSPDLRFTRLETLNSLSESSNSIVITNLMGYLKYLPTKNSVKTYKLKVNDFIDRSTFINLLDNYGYTRESLVTSTSEYSVRGMIIDVFPMYDNYPVRIEFDGNVVESLSTFNEDTQITIDSISLVRISPANEVVKDKHGSLLDFLKNKNVFFIEEQQIDAGYKKLQEDILACNQKTQYVDNFLFKKSELTPDKKIFINEFSSVNDILYGSKTINNYQNNFDKLKADFYKYKKLGYEVIFCLSLKTQVKKIKELLPSAKILNKKINAGFVIDKFVIISEFDIDKVQESSSKYKGTFKFGKKLKSYESLEIGDYVVHIQNGIGIYSGIKKIIKNSVEKDYIQILYSGDDKVYIPVEKINTIYKYGDKDGKKPTISKLDGISWKKTRTYIQNHVKDISGELINLYKARLEVKSEEYKLNFEDEAKFDSSFPYQLTKNQISSNEDISKDLQSDNPMDRLLCGDVGFGKTEVAFRAMFTSVLNNKQVMYLCPTTILSLQQYNVAIERFKDWPIEIALLNRFVPLKEVNTILNRFKDGKIDILFGTHRILSEDVKSKRLGLLVIDEEQRFGVNHKEKIKKLKKDINVLTLSATPIPRTLKMAISGIRDLSIIDTPPVNRYPIQTYVLALDEFIIKDAIYKELSRKGQVFILHNRVLSIESFATKISKLVPEANVVYAHGKMSKEDLEDRMQSFIDGTFNVLVCTTIIESGIDIPNANTLLVINADKFGLSQLYQIRGRVGRSDRIAYAYLFYDDNKVLTETAVKRLKAIKDFTELGSGYKIAMRDLSIRGAGDIFGSSQAGFVDAVGISLYLKLIDNEVKKQSGQVVEDEEELNVLFDVENHIKDDYVSDEDIKIEIHKLINQVDNKDKFNDIYKVLNNRFGKLPEYLEIYMYEEWFESLAKSLSIIKVNKTNVVVEVFIPHSVSSNVEGDKLLMLAYNINKKFIIKYINGQIVITLPYKLLEKHFLIYLVELLELIKKDCLKDK